MNFIDLSAATWLTVEHLFQVIENEPLIDELLDSFKIWQKLFFIVMGVLHEREMAVDLVQLIFEVILKLELL